MSEIVDTAQYLEKLDLETREQLGFLLASQFVDSQLASAQMRQDVAAIRDQVVGNLPEKTLKWSSNINIPTTEYMTEMLTINISKVLFGADRYFQVESELPEHNEYATVRELELQYWCERMRLANKGTLSIREAVLTGQCWLRAGIKPTGKSLPEEMAWGTPINAADLDIEPTSDYVITEDMMLLPHTAPSFSQARGAFARRMLSWNDLVLAEKSKTFYQDAIDHVREHWQETPPTTQIQDNQGIEAQVTNGQQQALFECWEGVCRWRKPDEDEERLWFMTIYYPLVAAGQAIVLRCVDYKSLYGTSQWLFSPIIINPQPNSMWGRSCAQKIAGLQRYINAMFQASTDAITMAVLPPIAVRSGSALARKKLDWRPMAIWEIDNPAQDLQMLGSSSTSIAGINAGMNQVAFAQASAERLLGVSDPTAGRPTQQQKTAFELGAVIESGNQIFEHHLRSVESGMDADQGFEGHAQMLMAMLDAFMPDADIRVRMANAGTRDEFQTVPQASRGGQYRLTAHANNAVNSPQIRAQRAMAMRTAAMQSPFVMLSPMDTPENVLEKVQRMYDVERNYYVAMGEKQPEELMGSKPQDPEEGMKIAFGVNPQVAGAIMQRTMGPPALPGPAPVGPPGGPVGPAPPEINPGAAPGLPGDIPINPEAVAAAAGPAGPPRPAGLANGADAVSGPAGPPGMVPL